MQNHLNLLTWLISIVSLSKPQFNTDYCSFDCANGVSKFVHTVCKRDYRCNPENTCEEIPPDDNFRNKMVISHNEYRNFVANGSNMEGYNHYKNPGATNMNALSYDLELEYIARCWVNTCTTGKHDECRDVSRFFVGQNIYWGQRSDLKEAMSKQSVWLWFEEMQHITNSKWIKNFPGTSGFPNDRRQRLHFTQVVWANTKYVGCARIRFKEDYNQGTLICNYGPSGNMVGMPVYHLASVSRSIASECTVRNKKWNALCGEVSSVAEDTFKPPYHLPKPIEAKKSPSYSTVRPALPDCSSDEGLSPQEMEFCEKWKALQEKSRNSSFRHPLSTFLEVVFCISVVVSIFPLIYIQKFYT